MSQWVFIVAMVAAAVGVFVWLRVTGTTGPQPLDFSRLPRWVRDLGQRLPRRSAQPAPATLARVTRQVLDEVIGLGDKTMRDRSLIIPNLVDVHCHPDDATLVHAHRSVIEREVTAEIAASGNRERWVSAGPLKIMHIIEDDKISVGKPMVQRATPAQVDGDPRGGQPRHGGRGGPQPRTRFVLIDENDREPRPLPVPDDGGRVGRDPRKCAVVVDSSTVSREHAELTADADGFRVRDLGSVNGIRINGTRVSEGYLRPGDVLGLGRSKRFRLATRSGSAGTRTLIDGQSGLQ